VRLPPRPAWVVMPSVTQPRNAAATGLLL
jgi:hypothetical protein